MLQVSPFGIKQADSTEARNRQGKRLTTVKEGHVGQPRKKAAVGKGYTPTCTLAPP